MSKSSGPRRVWLLFSQAVTILADAIVAWQAFAPGTPLAHRPDVVAFQEAAEHPTEPTVVQGLAGGFRTAARKASTLVVNVYTSKASTRPSGGWRGALGGLENDSARSQSSLGSGVIVAAQGYILTNNHVIDGADAITVMLPGEKVAEARVVGTDPETDLAVLQVKAKGLQPIAFADPTSVQVGDIVLAVGDPFGVGKTVTQGIVSATGRNRLGINTFENFIQTDAAINLGN